MSSDPEINDELGVPWDDDKIGFTVETNAGTLEMYLWGPLNKLKALKTLLFINFPVSDYETEFDEINHDNGFGTLSMIRRLIPISKDLDELESDI